MKISELSQTCEIPVPTIKFYIREGLLPAGARTARNQADYGAAHVQRLALIRAMREAAGLSIEVIARVLHAADSAKEDFVIAAVNALERPLQVAVDASSENYAEAERLLLALSKRRGWSITASDGALRDAVKALAVVIGSFTEKHEEGLEVYADAAERVAELEIPSDWQPDASPDAAVRYAVLGTVLFEPFILALRRMANVARTRKVTRKGPASKRSPGQAGAETKASARRPSAK